MVDRFLSQGYRTWYHSPSALYNLLPHLRVLFTETEKHDHITKKAANSSYSDCISFALAVKKTFLS